MLTFLGTLLAQDGVLNLQPDRGIAQNAGQLQIETLFPSAVNILFIIAAVVFFFMLVIGGIRWIASGGDKGKTESAKSQITSAIIGLVLVLSAYAIVRLIALFFGVNILDSDSLNINPIGS